MTYDIKCPDCGERVVLSGIVVYSLAGIDVSSVAASCYGCGWFKRGDDAYEFIMENTHVRG